MNDGASTRMRSTALAGELSGEIRARAGQHAEHRISRLSPMNSKLYVGNLSFETTEADLRDAFGRVGTVAEVRIASDRFTGRPRGFAFVTFSTEAESKLAAKKLNGVAV